MSFTLFAMQKQKTKSKPEVFNFSAIHLIHDPQGKHALYFVFIQVMCLSQTLKLKHFCKENESDKEIQM